MIHHAKIQDAEVAQAKVEQAEVFGEQMSSPLSHELTLDSPPCIYRLGEDTS